MRPGGGYGYSRVGRYGGHADTAGMRIQQACGPAAWDEEKRKGGEWNEAGK